MTPTVRVYRDADAMIRAAAALVRYTMGAAVRTRGRASLALSGGSTPRPLYEQLSRSIDAADPTWAAVDFFWSDERWVPPTSAESNYRLAEEALLRPAGVDRKRVHPIDTVATTPGAAALAYERSLRAGFGNDDATFDLTLLGVGEDGHTASLFPRSTAAQESVRWAVAVPTAPQPPHVRRITLTLPVLNASRIVAVLATGAQKASIVARCLRPAGRISRDLPAQRLAAREETLWLLDSAAAAKLPDRRLGGVTAQRAG